MADFKIKYKIKINSGNNIGFLIRGKPAPNSIFQRKSIDRIGAFDLIHFDLNVHGFRDLYISGMREFQFFFALLVREG